MLKDEDRIFKNLYGLDNPTTANFGRQCLMARRFAERGVRFIQISHSYKWDQHDNLRADHQRNASEVDQPIAALLQDMKARGLLEDTLIMWGGEFGRTPWSQDLSGTAPIETHGREHQPESFTAFLAGGGVKRGFSFGETDEFGHKAVKDVVNHYDYHATLLHLFGLDAGKLSFARPGGVGTLLDGQPGKIVGDLLKRPPAATAPIGGSATT